MRVLELSRSNVLGVASKVNRDPAFIAALIAEGEQRAEDFLSALAFERAWRGGDPDAITGLLADDAHLHSAAPFPVADLRGATAIRAFAREHLGTGIVVDRTRKQLTGERIAWEVRTRPAGDGPPARGRAVAELRDGRVAALRARPGAVVSPGGAA